jgi:predicted AlkP superfamily phosphohydrolase/phosphomutase
MSEPQRKRAIVFGADGMRHDLMIRYAAAGAMPTVAGLLARGASGEGGCYPSLPANTGAGWATLQTGAWSGTTGAINNVFHRTDTPITQPQSGFDATLIAAETLAQAAERQGLTTAMLEWPGTLPATSRGTVIDFRAFYAARGALLIGDPPDYLPELARRFGLLDQRARFVAANDWRNLPHSSLPPREALLEIASSRPEENPPRTYYVLAYATAGHGYDRLLVATERDGLCAVAELAQGDWAPVRVSLRDGRAAGFQLKLIALAPDLSRLWLYVTTLSRARAGTPELEEEINRAPYPISETADHSPLECGLIDEATYVEQAMQFLPRARQVLRRVVERERPDLLFAGMPITDEFSHQFLGLTTPACPAYDAARAPHYEALIREGYVAADQLLGYLLDLYRALYGDDEPLVAVCSDHGFGGAWLSINANLVLEHAGLLLPDAAGRPLPQSMTAAYWAGGTCNVYINLAGRQPGGVVPAEQFSSVQARIIAAFRALNESEAAPPIAAVLRFDELAAVPVGNGAASMQFPGRSGDVVVFATPPHQFDAPSPAAVVAPSPLYGQHGYLPDTVEPRFLCDMRSPFLLAGPGVSAGQRFSGARAIDLAPTIAALLGIEPPHQADGRALLAD